MQLFGGSLRKKYIHTKRQTGGKHYIACVANRHRERQSLYEQEGMV